MELDVSGDLRATPYQLPNPAGASDEIVVASAVPVDERQWVPQADNVWFRPRCLSVSNVYWMNLLRARPSGVLNRHRHSLLVHGFVLNAARSRCGGRRRAPTTDGRDPPASKSSSLMPRQPTRR